MKLGVFFRKAPGSDASGLSRGCGVLVALPAKPRGRGHHAGPLNVAGFVLRDIV